MAYLTAAGKKPSQALPKLRHLCLVPPSGNLWHSGETSMARFTSIIGFGGMEICSMHARRIAGNICVYVYMCMSVRVCYRTVSTCWI